MAATRYDNIVTALLARLEAITQAAGYRTDAGEHVFLNLELATEPKDLPCLILRPGDVVDSEDETVAIGEEGHALPVEIEGIIEDTEDGASGQQLRQDILQALKSDQSFGGLVQEGITASSSSVETYDAGEEGMRSQVQVNVTLSYLTTYGAC